MGDLHAELTAVRELLAAEKAKTDLLEAEIARLHAELEAPSQPLEIEG